MGKFYYGVKEGREIGVYETWAECEAQVKEYPKARFKKFKSYEEAENFVQGNEEGEKPEESQEIDIDSIKEGELVAYVDGSFHLEDFAYSYGVVLFYLNGKETYSVKMTDMEMAKMRNVAGEISGAIRAMEEAVKRGYKKLYIHYDYKGIEEWALGNWKTNEVGTKNYKAYYDSIKDKVYVKFVKVEAHTGVKYNEEADRLAKDALGIK